MRIYSGLQIRLGFHVVCSFGIAKCKPPAIRLRPVGGRDEELDHIVMNGDGDRQRFKRAGSPAAVLYPIGEPNEPNG